MKFVTAFVYFVLLTVFFCSSCLLIFLVSADGVTADELQADETESASDLFVVQVNTTDLNASDSDNSSKGLREFPNEVLLDEIHSSFDEVILSTIRDEEATKELLPAARLKYTVAVNELSEGGGVIVGDVVADNGSAKNEGVEEGAEGDMSSLGGQIALDPGGRPDQSTMGAVATGPSGSQSSVIPSPSSIHSSVPAPDGLPPSPAETPVPPVGPTEVPDDVTTKPSTNDTQQTEDIPSFNEWAKKQLKEAEKNKGENLTWGGQTGGSGNHRKKNYASPDCGAKVVSSNPEAISPSALLSPNRDEYLLNPCTAKIWVVVELCEAIQPQRIELANFELFSSSPRELTVYLSDYPSREWTETASLTAKDERNIQSFPLPHLPQFVKFIKLELHSHYGTEHFCPLSLFRVFGTSEYEVLESVDGGPPAAPNEETDVDVPEVEPEGTERENLFGSAKAAVLSLVRRAAEVLVVKSPGVANSSCREDPAPQYTDHCITPSYLLVCDNCTDHFFYRVYNLVCCQQEMLKSLMDSNFVSNVLETGSLCSKIGLDWTKVYNETHTKTRSKTSPNDRFPQSDYLSAMLPSETIAALCNMMAVSRRKIVLNVTSSEEVPSPPLDEPPNNQVEVPVAPLDSVTPTVDPVMSTTPPLNNSLVDISSTSALPPSNSTVAINSSSSMPNDQKIVDGNTTQLNDESKNADEIKPDAEVNATLVGEPGFDAVTLDSIFSVLEDEPEQGSIRATSTHQPKESVFVRLANRIKVLETNLSLSSAYLEALSLRYKKQVEELQKSLNSVMEERRQALEREAVLTAQVSALVQRVDAITSAMTEIIMERESWFSKLTSAGQHGIIIAIEVSLFVLVLSICKWLGSGEQSTSGPRCLVDISQSRRKSLDDMLPRTRRKRRPSEEALTVSGSTYNELLLPPNHNGGKRKTSRSETRRKKKRKKELQEEQQGSKVRSVGSIELTRVVPVDKPSNGNGAVRGVVPCESSTDSRPGSVESSRPESTEPTLGPKAPSFIRTALWSRKHRSSVSSGRQESISSQDTQTSTKSKKGGVFKKFVRKIF